MRRKINTERIERLARDTRVLSKVVDHLMEELFLGSSSSSINPNPTRSLDNRIAHLFEQDQDSF